MEKITRRKALATLPAVGTAVVVPAVAEAVENEHPAAKVRRLARELADAMVEVPEYAANAIVYPSGSGDGIYFLCDQQYSRMTRAMLEYQKAHQEKIRAYAETFAPDERIPLPERPEHRRYWDAFHRCNQAQYALMDAFEAGPIIDG